MSIKYLRITEIMYHPLDTDDPNDANTEYIELKNTGALTINLNLVSSQRASISHSAPTRLRPNNISSS